VKNVTYVTFIILLCAIVGYLFISWTIDVNFRLTDINSQLHKVSTEFLRRDEVELAARQQEILNKLIQVEALIRETLAVKESVEQK
jgi:uncharacterized membrane protein